MSGIKFNPQQIERFNDRIENCLMDSSCRNVLEYYLKRTKKNQLLKVLKLWQKADENGEELDDYIDEVDGFNSNPLLSLAEPEQKTAYIRSECCRLLNAHDNHRRFVDYLSMHHRQF